MDAYVMGGVCGKVKPGSALAKAMKEDKGALTPGEDTRSTRDNLEEKMKGIKTYYDIERKEGLFSLPHCIWYTYGALLQQGKY